MLNNFNFLEIFYYINITWLEFNIFYFNFFSLINIFALSIFVFFKNIIPNFLLKLNISFSIIFLIKFLILIALLIFIRGGIPRYRYDFLTKVGWIKFLSLILSIFLFSLIVVYIL